MAQNSNFTHAVDRSVIPTVNILGVEIAAINMDWLMRFTKDHVRELSGDYICVSNVHTTVTAFDDPAYRTVQNGGILAIPDGGPLSSVGRKRGFDMSRTTGPEYMERVFMASGENGYRHFFYGSTEDTLSNLRLRLQEEYPNLRVVGMVSPPFRPLTAQEDEQVVAQVNAVAPDFLWVGLGAPKQEIWMAEHQGKVNGLMVGVGAAFDYYARNIRRAPDWMQKHNLEWLYRLMQDPKRLFRRYLVTNTRFIWNAVVKNQ